MKLNKKSSRKTQRAIERQLGAGKSLAKLLAGFAASAALAGNGQVANPANVSDAAPAARAAWDWDRWATSGAPMHPDLYGPTEIPYDPTEIPYDPPEIPYDPTEMYITIVFDLGEHGVCADGGELTQTVLLEYVGNHPEDSLAPNVKADGGYRFVGWREDAYPTDMAITERRFTAMYELIGYAISYEGVRGGANPNPTSYTVLDAFAFEPLADVPGWKFAGWSVAGVAAGTTGDLTVTALWKKDWADVPEDDVSMDAGVANVYDGVVVDADGLPAGSVSIKTGKVSKAGTAQATATILMAGESRKTTVKGTVDIASGEMTGRAQDGRALRVRFTRNTLSGTFGPCVVAGARNRFALAGKTAADRGDKVAADAVLSRHVGAHVLAFGDGSGWSALSVTVAAKGKVKISGRLADGTGVSATSQLVVGRERCFIPVVYTKKSVSFAFCIDLPVADGAEPSVSGRQDAVFSSATGLGWSAEFLLGERLYDVLAANGYDLAGEFLPTGIPVRQSGAKWIVADGAKAGRIKMDREGVIYDQNGSENPSGLKLSYVAKTGLFKGSFKAYARDGAGRLKSFAVTVNGGVVDGCGYGTATVKNLGAAPVSIL